MADGLGSLPIEAKMAAGDGKIGGHGKLFAGADAEQRAVVADAETQCAAGELSCPRADLLQDCYFARLGGMGLLGTGLHDLRIGYRGCGSAGTAGRAWLQGGGRKVVMC